MICWCFTLTHTRTRTHARTHIILSLRKPIVTYTYVRSQCAWFLRTLKLSRTMRLKLKSNFWTKLTRTYYTDRLAVKFSQYAQKINWVSVWNFCRAFPNMHIENRFIISHKIFGFMRLNHIKSNIYINIVPKWKTLLTSVWIFCAQLHMQLSTANIKSIPKSTVTVFWRTLVYVIYQFVKLNTNLTIIL